MQELFNNTIIKVEVTVSGEFVVTALKAIGMPVIQVGATDKGVRITSPNNSIFNPTCFGPVNGFLVSRNVVVNPPTFLNAIQEEKANVISDPPRS